MIQHLSHLPTGASGVGVSYWQWGHGDNKMKTTCTDCGKVYEAQGYDTDEGTCYACALESITDGRPPETEDITTAYFVSREMSMEEWLDFQAELRRYHPGDFYEEEPKWCNYCNSFTCRCAEPREGRQHEQEWEMDRLYYEALDEDLQRKIDADQEAEQALWDAEIAEWERLETESFEFWSREEDWNDSFIPFLYNIFGSSNYNRFVAPILIRLLRFKKRWRR